MSYNFDTIYDRSNTECIKYSRNPFAHHNPIPMGIADMELAIPEFVIKGIADRLSHPILGYFRPKERFYSSIIRWHKNRFHIEDMECDNILYQHSVLGGVATAIELYSSEGEAIILQTPGYSNFGAIIEQHKRKIVTNPLLRTDSGYMMDLVDLEEKIQKNSVKILIFCSPHNPTGRVWSKEEITGVVNICHKYGVKIIADEIWSDMILTGKHTPMHTVSQKAKEITISLYSPSKTFNIAGLVIAYAVIFNEKIKAEFQEAAELSHYNNCNVLSMEATISAYNNGLEWTMELCGYIDDNVSLVMDTIREHMPRVKVARPQGTYLMWLDFSDMGLTPEQLLEISGKEGLYFNDGRTCVANGESCLRMNIAMPRKILADALERMERIFGAHCR